MTVFLSIGRDDGERPKRWEGEPRKCPTCGKTVNPYKNPRSTTPVCYACEDKMPWTYTNIVGSEVGLSNAARRVAEWTDNPVGYQGHSMQKQARNLEES